jgi:4-amino-4-deoxy-L-arabinose transferase-like glycosyltransferase
MRRNAVEGAPLTGRPTREWPALLAILGVFAVGWLLVGPRADVPVIDDWVYAWSVEHLLDTGRVQVLDISAFYPIAQILWGALFARLAGFSFVVLRSSTVVLAVLGCWAVYLTLRELDCRRSTALLGALALAFDPVYFALSFSFMTEVPFVSFSTMALYWYIRAIRRHEIPAVWVGCLCAMAAFLTRPIGIVLPLALLPALVGSPDSRTMFRRSARWGFSPGRPFGRTTSAGGSWCRSPTISGGTWKRWSCWCFLSRRCYLRTPFAGGTRLKRSPQRSS